VFAESMVSVGVTGEEPTREVQVDQTPAKDNVAYQMLASVPRTTRWSWLPSLTIAGVAKVLSGTGVRLDVSHAAAHAPEVNAL